jgi:GT2 family glycosyltransferase
VPSADAPNDERGLLTARPNGPTGDRPRIAVVIPVFNKRRYLSACIDAVLAAARRYGPVELVLVDHHSTDGSYEFLERYRTEARVVRFDGGTISAVRNHGASLTTGDLLSFLDCDCVVPPDYFDALADVFSRTGAGAAGCEVNIPTPAHWSEAVWHRLHVIGTDGYRHYLNSANFAVHRQVFDQIGGFDESLVTGEDTDICTRVRLAGHTIFESHRLSVVHLDNPKSLPAFYRKEVWRGLGAFSGTLRTHVNRATLMVFANMLLTVLALALLLAPGGLSVPTRALLAGGLVLAVPTATVLYRFGETRRVTNPPAALLLYTVYYAARSHALLRTLFHDATPRRTPRLTRAASGEHPAS